MERSGALGHSNLDPDFCASAAFLKAPLRRLSSLWFDNMADTFEFWVGASPNARGKRANSRATKRNFKRVLGKPYLPAHF